MVKVTIMIWFETETGEPRFRDLEVSMFAWDAQDSADFHAANHRNGQCKIFENSTGKVIARSGFE